MNTPTLEPVAQLAIEGYSSIEPIGRGGLGDVYRAVQRSTGAAVAIKVLRPEGGMVSADNSVSWHRCRRELAALVALAGHAHVVAVMEVLDTPGGPALVMEYAPGGSVADLVARRGAPLSVGEVALIGVHTAEALVAAHARGIVHRDVKPHNLLIDAFGQVKLCDFGVAALARSTDFRTRTAAVSLRYASPEDLEDDGPVGPAADVYSLGATLLFLTHGLHLELRDRLTPWRPPGGSPPELAALDELIGACLRPDPAERPGAGAVLLTLDRIAATAAERCRALPVPEPVSSPAATADPARTVARPARHLYRAPEPEVAAPRQGRARRIVVGGAIASVAVVLSAFWWWAGADRSGSAPAGPVSPGIVDRPDGLVELTALVWPAGPVGECLVQEPGVSQLQPVSCDEPHDLERVASASLDSSAATLACGDLAAEYAGRPLDELGLAGSSTRPSEAGWAAGDHTYQCWIGAPGHRIVGTARA